MPLDKRDFPGTTFPEHMHWFTATKPYPAYGPRHTIKVEAGLHYLTGNQLPYFVVGAEIGRPDARDCDACGCLHEDVLKLWPELAPIVALHLSDSDGKPMHAEANSWYELAGHYGGADEKYHAGNSKRRYGGQYREPTPEECLVNFARYVRIPLEQARELAQQWARPDDWASSRQWFKQWIEAQLPRWAAEAEAGCQLLDKLTAEGFNPDML